MSKNKKRDLGKGVGSLLGSYANAPILNPSNDNKSPEATDMVASIPVDNIQVNPHQPRKHFDEAKLRELSESIQSHGLIQPITVSKKADGTFLLISGERRLRATKLAGIPTIPAYMLEVKEKQQIQEMALIENLQREDLTPMELAMTYKALIDNYYNNSQGELAKKIGKSRIHVQQVVSLLNLSPDVVEALNNKTISRGHAIKLAPRDKDTQAILLEKIIAGGLSVRQLEALVRNLDQPKEETVHTVRKPNDLPLEYKDVHNRLKTFFGAKINLKVKEDESGQIVIPFKDTKDLNRLLDLLEE